MLQKPYGNGPIGDTQFRSTVVVTEARTTATVSGGHWLRHFWIGRQASDAFAARSPFGRLPLEKGEQSGVCFGVRPIQWVSAELAADILSALEPEAYP